MRPSIVCLAALGFAAASLTATAGPADIPVPSANSIIHIGSLDSFDLTPGGIEAARTLLNALEKHNVDLANEAIARYDQITPKENFGGEYTALQWFAEYLAATPGQRAQFFKDPLEKAYFDFFANDDFKVLKEYIKRKYKFTKWKSEDPEVGHTRRSFLEDFILFNNPKRENWEHTSKLLPMLRIQPGEKIIDCGCGPGYFTYRFSKMVGPSGRIYATDIKQEHLDFLNKFLKDQKISNVKTLMARTDDVTVTDTVDTVYLCSLYHIIYGVSSEKERSSFVESIKRVLKPAGRLIIVDNGPVPDGVLPYHGPYIAKELTIAQMDAYGFELKRYEQPIPQRYLLEFKKKKQ